MLINADLNLRAVCSPDHYQWVDSPMPGVARMMLDRIAMRLLEQLHWFATHRTVTFHRIHMTVAKNSSCWKVRSAMNISFITAGTYVRNPIGTSHSPRVGKDGCLIFVKLHQFAADDDRSVALDTNTASWRTTDFAGLEIMPLAQARVRKSGVTQVGP